MVEGMQSGRAPELAAALRAGLDGDAGSAPQILTKLLQAVREHFSMEAAFVSRFELGKRVFKVVDALPGVCELPIGGGDPLAESYCQRIVDGRLPELIQNAQDEPVALELAATRALPVGAHLSIPLRLSDGSVYGTFCCFSRSADYTLNARDTALMRAFADVAASVIERDMTSAKRDLECKRRVEAVLQGDKLSMAYQPILDLESDRVVGFESLARFAALPMRSPDLWFAEATLVGLGDALEAYAIRATLAAGLPSPEVYVACNVSPDIVLNAQLPAALYDGDVSHIVLELTEHCCIDDYERVEQMLRPLRARGLRLAVDDAGAGYASFRHILRLRPDHIKLDMSLTRNIDTDKSKRALALALIEFARETGSELIAEGIETQGELATLRELGVMRGQGYLLGRPAPFSAAQQLLDATYHA